MNMDSSLETLSNSHLVWHILSSSSAKASSLENSSWVILIDMMFRFHAGRNNMLVSATEHQGQWAKQSCLLFLKSIQSLNNMMHDVWSIAVAATKFNEVFSGNQQHQIMTENWCFENHLSSHHQGCDGCEAQEVAYTYTGSRWLLPQGNPCI